MAGIGSSSGSCKPRRSSSNQGCSSKSYVLNIDISRQSKSRASEGKGGDCIASEDIYDRYAPRYSSSSTESRAERISWSSSGSTKHFLKFIAGWHSALAGEGHEV